MRTVSSFLLREGDTIDRGLRRSTRVSCEHYPDRILTHFAAIACKGNAEPKRTDLAKWLRYFNEDAWISRQEDPVEDAFIGCVNSDFGSFRLFSGILADGCFTVERLVAFLAKARSFPTFQETLDAGLALLRLSDALAGRCGLKRNTLGGGDSASNIALPRWRDLKPASAALVFTHAELQELHLSVQSLEPFIFNDDHLKLLANERLWNSSLERHPLLQIEDGILIAEPSSLYGRSLGGLSNESQSHTWALGGHVPSAG